MSQPDAIIRIKNLRLRSVGKAQRHPSVRDPKFHTKTTFPILMQRIANNIRCRFTGGEIERKTPLVRNRQRSHLLGKPLRQR